MNLYEKYGIPEKIKIGGHWIRIKFYCKIEDIEDESDVIGIKSSGLYDNISSGLYVRRSMTIYISTDQSDSHVYSTYIHEILESINTIYDLNLQHHKICLFESILFEMGIKF